MSLHTKTLIALVLGATLGGGANEFLGAEAIAPLVKWGTYPAGQIYLRLLLMLVVPTMFSALALGVADLGDIGKLGRVGLQTLVYTVFVSAIAVLIGLAAVHLFEPGKGFDLSALTAAQAERAKALAASTSAGPSGIDLFLNIIPKHPIGAMASGDMLGVLFFSLFIGIGLLLTQTPSVGVFRDALQGLYDVCMRLLGLVIRLSPVGVFALLFTLTAELGFAILLKLALYVGVVLGALAVHQFGVYSAILAFLARRNPMTFFRAIQPAMVTAFSTASSSATLPTALKVAEENLRLPRDISRFVLTIGSTANQNGTALFEGVTVLFLAQLYGIDLSLGQQLMVFGLCILGGVGTAGVPAGSIPVVIMILGLVNVPPEGLGLILGVDRLLDMCRTTLNVTGDLVAAAVVSGPPDTPTAS